MTDPVQAAADVLTLCFPGSRIRLHVVEDEGALSPSVHWAPGLEGAGNAMPLLHTTEFIAAAAAAAVRSGDKPEFPSVTATLILGKGREAGQNFSWRPRGRWQALVLKRYPIAYEQLKFAFEALLRWRTDRRARRLSSSPPSGEAERPRWTSRAPRPSLIMAMYWLDPGGAESFALQCIAEAEARGFDVLVLCDQPSQHLANSASVESDNVKRIRSELLADRTLYRRLVLGLLDRYPVAAIHIHHSDRMYDLLPELAARAASPIIIDSTHIVEHRDGGYVHRSASLSRFIDHHHVISRNLRDEYRLRFGRTRNVHLGYLLAPRSADINPPTFSILHAKKTVTVGFVGRLAHQKRPLLFLEVARRLTQTKGGSNEFRFKLIGDGPFMAVAERTAAAFGLAAIVEFMGHRSDIGNLMAELDILLIPSGNEGLTLVTYEAFAAGTLVVSSDVGAQRELVPPDLLLDPSPFAFCTAAVNTIERLATDPDFAARQVEAFAARHREVATGPRAIEVIGTLYGQVG